MNTNLYDTLTRCEVKQSPSTKGDVILTKDKIGPGGELKERHIVMFTPCPVIPQVLRLADERTG